MKRKILSALFLLLFSLSAVTYGKTIIKIGTDTILPKGKTFENIVLVGGSLAIDNKIKQNLLNIGGTIAIGPNTIIEGKLINIGGKIIKDPLAIINSEEMDIKVDTTTSASPIYHSKPIINLSLGVFAFLLVMFIISYYFPDTISYVSIIIQKSIWLNIFIGTLGIISIIPIIFFLILSILGIILIPVQLTLIAICFIIGYTAISNIFGKKILEKIKRKKQYPIFVNVILGAMALFLISIIPFIGKITYFLVGLIGYGASLIAFFKYALTKITK